MCGVWGVPQEEHGGFYGLAATAGAPSPSGFFWVFFARCGGDADLKGKPVTAWAQLL